MSQQQLGVVAGRRPAVRFTSVAFILAIVAALVSVSALQAAVSRAANHALAVPGTGNPTPTPGFINAEVRNFITPTNPACGSTLDGPSPSCTQTAVDYPASFWPVILFGLKQLTSPTWNVSVSTGVNNLENELEQAYFADPSGHFYLTGYSQGATVVSYFKRNYPSDPVGQNLPPLNQVTMVLAANPNRPNGGLFMRPGIFGPLDIPILDATVGIPAPTDTGIRTTDLAIQYDGVSDFPKYPLNVLAVLNALAGTLFIHPTYVFPNTAHPDGHPYGYTLDEFSAAVAAAQHAADAGACSAATNCQQFGDTTYITLPTTDLPLLAPLRYLGERTGLSFVTRPLADLVQPVLKVLIETGYDRTSYGTPSPFGLLPLLNPVEVGVDLVEATAQGITDAVGDITGTRPAGPPTQDPFATAASLLSGQDVDDQTVPAPKGVSDPPEAVFEAPKAVSEAPKVVSGKPVKPTRPATTAATSPKGASHDAHGSTTKRPATPDAGAKPASETSGTPAKRVPPRR
jgi:hypothetical protein